MFPVFSRSTYTNASKCVLKFICLNNNQRFMTDIQLRSVHSNTSPAQQEKWDLMSAVSLERKPVIARKLHPIEEKMMNLFEQTEFEMSFKSDHEIRLLTDEIKIEQLKKGDKNFDIEQIAHQTGQDFEDACQVELKEFKFADRLTEDDKSNNLKSTNRKLDRNLLLLIKDKINDKQIWILPQGIRKEGETLRQTAERVLKEKCGEEIQAAFFGNAPVGIYKYKYPKSLTKENDSPIGAKIFFYKAQLLSGNVKKDLQKCVDFQWATRSELNVLHKDYHKSVSMFLVDEDH